MGDQAQKLRDLMGARQGRARVVAVTSGKGGVGKSNTTVNLAIALSKLGKRVLVLDADLGLANVEVLMGLNSPYNIENVIEGEKTLAEVLVRAPGGIQIVPGSSGLARIADLGAVARERVIGGLEQLQSLADYILIDTMAGIGRNAVSFVTAADEVLLVTTPEPSAIVDAYAMLKSIHTNRREAVVRLVVNMAANQAQAQAVARKLTGVAEQYLGRNLGFLGYIPRDAHVSQAVMQSQPFMISFPNSDAARFMRVLAGRLADEHVAPLTGKEGFFRRFASNFGLASNG